MENKKLIYVDGPARSGSTYLCNLFGLAYGSDPFGQYGDVSVNVHATHETSVYELLSLLKPNAPLVVSIRNPKDNIVSSVIHSFWNAPSPESLNLIKHASNLENHFMYLVRHPKILAIPFEIFTKDHIQALDVFEGMFPEFAPYRKESVLSEEIIKKIEDVRGMEKNPEAYVATSSVPRRIELEYYTKAREAIYRQIEEIPSVALAVERASIPYRRLVERFSVLVEKYKN